MEQITETGPSTIRQQIIELLAAETLGARELSQELHQSEKEIYAHLEHIERSLKAEGKRLVIEPPVCLGCGFVFEERQRPQPPGHCPRCKKTRIRRPRYRFG
ncbi:transcriptional regulator [uncultured Desulfobulbus sp.]|uniref:transcriptional regulator n=1 Tax=uncultured Desulfobulbus sp. TaxID=239745 RepID=UPI0029C730FB|nr:transcriptional regulator [uncultured Desulfobulbus sp.]